MDFKDNNEVYKQLFYFIKKQETENFIILLDKQDNDFDINIRDDQNNYLLTYIVLFNNIFILKKIIDKNINLDIIDNDKKYILYHVIKYGYNEILELLLLKNTNTIGISIIDMIDNIKYSALHYAIYFKNIYAINRLLYYGSNTNITEQNGYNALHLAVYVKSESICNIIIKYIANINAKCNTGETALHIACNMQLNNIVIILLNSNVNINMQDNVHEITALHYCVHLNNIDLVNILLKYKADKNIQDLYGNTALHYTIIDNKLNIFKKLCDETTGIIDYNIWNISGQLPLHILLINDDITINTNLSEYLDILIVKSNFVIQDDFGNNCLHLLISNNLWKKYKKILATKKLDIFSKNNDNIMPIDLIDKKDYDEFMALITESYLYRLKNINTIWYEEWENMCVNNDINECSKLIRNKLDNILADIRNNKMIYCYNKSFPVKKQNICIDLIEGKKNNFCLFTGHTLDVLVGLIYLLKKHNDVCSVTNFNFTKNKTLCDFYRSNGLIMNNDCDFINFELLWVKQKLYIIEDFTNKIMKCNKRFIILPLGIDMVYASHSNYIIIDNHLKEIERFEPHGYKSPFGLDYNATLLDNTLELKFKSINNNYKYIKPFDFLPKIGFQIFESQEIKNKKIGDPEGFCALWSIWYVDMRLLQKDLDRKVLVNTLIKSIRNNNISFKNLIRNYAVEILQIRDALLSKINIDINDFINENYTDKQITTLIALLKKEIV